MAVSFLDVLAKDVGGLTESDLRELVARLCRAELSSLGLPTSAVTAGGGQDDPDGGLDVRVTLPPASHGLDFVLRPQTGYQVKATPMAPSRIAPEMRPHGKLRPVIQELLAVGGAYVIIGSKDSTADRALQARRAAMHLACGTAVDVGAGARDFYGSDRLADWVNKFPGLALWVRERIGAPATGWFGFGNWAHDIPGGDYILDDVPRVETQRSREVDTITALEAIHEIRTSLRQPASAVRLVGLSGTGKTRLVQALFEPGVGHDALPSHTAVYCDIGREPRPSALEVMHRFGLRGEHVVLIIDNCNPEAHRALVQAMGDIYPCLSLLTIEYDIGESDEPEETTVYRLNNSAADCLDAIIWRHAPELSTASRERLALLADGNARVALALARAARRTGNLGTLKDAQIFARLFWQRGGRDEQMERAAQALALVYSFDSTMTTADDDDSELGRLAQLAGMSIAELSRYAARLQKRGLAQRRGRWRAVLPHALANRLAQDSLELLDDTQLAQWLWGHERLLTSFARRISMLHDCPRACGIAASWLCDPRWLAKPEAYKPLGVTLFELMAPVQPGLALDVLISATSMPGVRIPLIADTHSRLIADSVPGDCGHRGWGA